MDVAYKVEVIMSTYNGMSYVGRQLDSILNQEGVDVHITIRDDGSKDSTISVLKSYEARYPDRISIIIGENIGYKRSFLSLLLYAKEADYYAFSDQDDIWESQKLLCALELIKSKDKVLYVSNLAICRSDLTEIGVTSFSPQNSSLYSEFVRHRYAGCTYVFDKQLKFIVSAFANLDLPTEQMPSHDSLIARCAYACGDVVVDSNTYIKHIRYDHSVTTKSNNLIERIKVEMRSLTTSSMTSTTARIILENISEYITNDSYAFLQRIVSYKKSITQWILLLFDSKMTSGIFICDVLCKLKILMRTY